MKKALKLLLWAILLCAIIITIWLPGNIQSFRDWMFLQTYTPTVQVAQLAKEAKLSDEGRRIYYVSDPQIQEKTAFSASCDFAEFNIVVGCYDGQIFVLDIDNPELEPGELVTAAHETLHAVYDRLAGDELNEINALLLEQERLISDVDVLETMALYLEQSPETYLDELHAIFGTEVRELLPGLTQHYDKYFDDRPALVEIAQAYDEIFSELEEEADALVDELNDLADELNYVGVQLKDWFNELEVKRISLQSRIDADEYSQVLINAINQFEYEVTQYNIDVAKYRIGLEEYDELKDRYDSIAVRHENLVNSIDSSYTPVSSGVE